MNNELLFHFGPKLEYSNFELELVKDIHGFTSKDVDKVKLAQYMNTEGYIKDGSIYQQYINSLPNELTQLEFQDVHSQLQLTKDIIMEWLDVLFRKHAKRRSLIFYGISNGGKSIIANAILYPFAPAMILNGGRNSSHWLENTYRKSLIIWEEPMIGPDNIEETKLLLGGEQLMINIKNKHLIERPNGPAVFVTTNSPFWLLYKNVLLNRSFIYQFTKPIQFSKVYTNKQFASYIKRILVDGS